MLLTCSLLSCGDSDQDDSDGDMFACLQEDPKTGAASECAQVDISSFQDDRDSLREELRRNCIGQQHTPLKACPRNSELREICRDGAAEIFRYGDADEDDAEQSTEKPGCETFEGA